MRVIHLGVVLVCVLFVVSLSNADQQQFEIMGFAECADCQLNNFKTSHAFSGLHVTIDCKMKKGIKRVGDSEVDESGKFKISIPKEIVRQVQFPKRKCYAQLHSAAAVPCPAHDGLKTAKIEFKSQIDNKIIFSPAKNLQFSTALCTSKLLWPFFDYPPLPKTDPWKKDWPKITFPPLENIGNPWAWPLPPTYKPKPKFKPKFKPSIFKPFPPPVPTYKPKPKFEPPVYKPLPPPVPFYKPPSKPIPPPFYKPTPKPPMVKPLPPPVPIYKPLPPQVPIYKPPVVKPLPPPVPIYKPPMVKSLPPPAPIYEPPVVTKPLPPPFPLFPLPPLYKKKKPCPPFTKMPPKYFEHPKFGYFPKLPPFNPNP